MTMVNELEPYEENNLDKDYLLRGCLELVELFMELDPKLNKMVTED
jgi:hypothetical protein